MRYSRSDRLLTKRVLTNDFLSGIFDVPLPRREHHITYTIRWQTDDDNQNVVMDITTVMDLPSITAQSHGTHCAVDQIGLHDKFRL